MFPQKKKKTNLLGVNIYQQDVTPNTKQKKQQKEKNSTTTNLRERTRKRIRRQREEDEHFKESEEIR